MRILDGGSLQSGNATTLNKTAFNTMTLSGGNCDIDFFIFRHRFHILRPKFPQFERVWNVANIINDTDIRHSELVISSCWKPLSSKTFVHLATQQLVRSTCSKSTHRSLSLWPLGHKAQDQCLGSLPFLILRSTLTDPLIHWCPHQSAIWCQFVLNIFEAKLWVWDIGS